VRPEALDAEEDEATPEADESSTKKAAASKTPSRDIRIEQVRSLATFMNVSTHRAGSRVVMLYPAEAMNPVSANALLKTLEEPPPDTVFLLVTHRIDRLLPTILSRCRQFPLQMPAPDKALSWLESQEVSNPARWLAEHGGAPLAALAAAVGEFADAQDEWLAYLARPHTATALVVAERLQKVPLSQLVAWQQRWLYDLLAIQSAGRVRYYPHHRKSLEALAAHTSADSLQQALRDAGFRRAVSEHPLSARLFIEDMLLDYVRLMQPPRAAARALCVRGGAVRSSAADPRHPHARAALCRHHAAPLRCLAGDSRSRGAVRRLHAFSQIWRHLRAGYSPEPSGRGNFFAADPDAG
jgi:DNA polymerase-3 subunit delta'